MQARPGAAPAPPTPARCRAGTRPARRPGPSRSRASPAPGPRSSRGSVASCGSARASAGAGSPSRTSTGRQGARGDVNLTGIEPARPPHKRVCCHYTTGTAEGAGVEPARLIARPPSKRVPSPIGWPFRYLSNRVDVTMHAPARNRTRNSSLGPRGDLRSTTGTPYVLAAEGKGFEPSFPGGNRVSSAARPTVSGYLPSFRSHQWTAGESNPDLLFARQVSSHWTSSP